MQEQCNPSKPGSPRKAWIAVHVDVLAASLLATISVVAICVKGERFAVLPTCVSLLIALVLIAFPKLIGERLPVWVTQSTPSMKAYVQGWMLLIGVAIAVFVYIYYYAGK